MHFTYGASVNEFNTNSYILDDKWHHVTFTRETTVGESRLYTDGIEQNRTNITANMDNVNVALLVGMRNGAAHPWNGQIDEVRLYNRALSAGEINKLYQMGR